MDLSGIRGRMVLGECPNLDFDPSKKSPNHCELLHNAIVEYRKANDEKIQLAIQTLSDDRTEADHINNLKNPPMDEAKRLYANAYRNWEVITELKDDLTKVLNVFKAAQEYLQEASEQYQCVKKLSHIEQDVLEPAQIKLNLLNSYEEIINFAVDDYTSKLAIILEKLPTTGKSINQLRGTINGTWFNNRKITSSNVTKHPRPEMPEDEESPGAGSSSSTATSVSAGDSPPSAESTDSSSSATGASASSSRSCSTSSAGGSPGNAEDHIAKGTRIATERPHLVLPKDGVEEGSKEFTFGAPSRNTSEQQAQKPSRRRGSEKCAAITSSGQASASKRKK